MFSISQLVFTSSKFVEVSQLQFQSNLMFSVITAGSFYLSVAIYGNIKFFENVPQLNVLRQLYNQHDILRCKRKVPFAISFYFSGVPVFGHSLETRFLLFFHCS